MEHFTEETLRIILWDVWQDFQRDEAERKRRAEDEESWRVAREHLRHRLQTKYFYKWRNNARSLATKRILREGKEKMRLYREQQQALQRQQQAEKEKAEKKAEKEAKRAAKRQLMDDTQRISLLAASTRRRGSMAYSADHNPEEQLLASGVFSGLRDDPRSVARRVVQEAGDAWAVASAPRSFRYAESELELEPAPSTRGSPDASSVGGRREGWKTRSLREKFGIEPRRSLSASGSVVNGDSFRSSSASRFRQSLPRNGAGKIMNFSRKRSAEHDESDDEHGANKKQSVYGNGCSAKPNGIAKSRHWELRVRGFVPTPDGNWLPEAIAKSMREKKACGSPPDDDYEHSPPLGDIDMTSAGADSRAASPTPSDLRLRLGRLIKKPPRPSFYSHGSRHSVDLPTATSAAGFAATNGLLSTSPPHPPFAAPARNSGDGQSGFTGKRKRASGVDGEDGDVGDEESEMSPLARKKANLVDAATLGREETSAIVENTRKMLRDLREFMDRVDREEGVRT
jgi:hypothetical protein